jgi:hypothetical protein
VFVVVVIMVMISVMVVMWMVLPNSHYNLRGRRRFRCAKQHND